MKMLRQAKTLIYFLDADTVDLGDLNMASLTKAGSYHALRLRSLARLPKNLSRAEVVISNKFQLGETQLARLPALKLICVAATGVNNVDLDAAQRRGIAVCNVAAYSTATVAEHAVMFLLALAHRLPEHHRAVLEGAWSQGPHFALLDFPFSDLVGKKLGILGYGAIGRRVAKLARALGMEILLGRLPGRSYSPKEKRLSLCSLLGRSDYVTLHCPLTPQTRHLIDAEKLRWMRPTAYLLNLARGPIVDEMAVAAALRAGKLAAYATDVMEREPPSADHPLFSPRLQGKVLFTPHIAWASRESRQRLIDEIAQNILSFLRGGKRNRIV